MSGNRSKRAQYRHPVNQRMIDEAPLGARIADRVTAFMGSWKFIAPGLVSATAVGPRRPRDRFVRGSLRILGGSARIVWMP